MGRPGTVLLAFVLLSLAVALAPRTADAGDADEPFASRVARVDEGASVTVYEVTSGLFEHTFDTATLMGPGGRFSTVASEQYNVTSDGMYLTIWCYRPTWDNGTRAGNNIAAVRLDGVPGFPSGIWATTIVSYVMGYGGTEATRFNALGDNLSDFTRMGDQYSELVLGFEVEVNVASITVDTVPAGLQVGVDGAIHAAPFTFDCTANTSRIVEAPSPQGGGDSRFAFDRWSDQGMRVHPVACAGPATVTAYFVEEHRVTVSTVPEGLDTIVDDETVATPAGFWWREGSRHVIEAPQAQEFEATAYGFEAWRDGAERERTVTVEGPSAYVAVYAPVGPPVAWNLKPMVAIAFTAALVLAGVARSRSRPYPFRVARRRELKTFLALALPFVAAEASTGVVSLFTGILAIPPLLGWGTLVDGALLAAGLAAIAVPRGAPSPTAGAVSPEHGSRRS